MPVDETTPWAVVVPVKRLTVAKSRLGAYGDALRAELALAFAADVVTAALATPGVLRVLVVTDDERAVGLLSRLGAATTPDGRAPDGPGAGLNPALDHGAALLRSALPGCGVAAVSADLPCLRSHDLQAALALVRPGQRAFVPDAEGRGTTLLAAAPGRELAAAYGPGSRERHLASGAVELGGTPALRRDVDTPQHLREALALGVGQCTAEAVVGLV